VTSVHSGQSRCGQARANATRIRPRLAVFRPALAAVLAALTLVAGVPRPARSQGAVSAIEADVDLIARRARPSMVTVVAQRTLLAQGRRGAPPTRRVHTRVGSGVAVEEDGVLTTASVVLGAEKLFVVTGNGLQVEAQLVGMDPVFNIALLRAPEIRLPPLRFAKRPGQLGDWVITLGSSYGAAPTQSVGNIAYRFREPRMSLLQLTNEVYPGNSGAAALNSRGELIGLVQGELGTPDASGATPDGERRPGGMSFVIPCEDIAPVYANLRRDGRVHHGFLGVSTHAGFVDSDTQPGLRVALGAIVESMQAGGPAERVGLRNGDLIVAYDGERVEYPEQLARWVAATPPATVVSLVWAHNDMRRSGRVTLGESPTPIPSWMLPQTAEAAPAPAPQASSPRMAELEAQIRRLNRELGRLRGQQDSAR
jgi:serine protease Do